MRGVCVGGVSNPAVIGSFATYTFLVKPIHQIKTHNCQSP